MSGPRRGTLLIIVAGLAALLAAITVAFLGRMREDGDDSLRLVREAQSRIMLDAALCYVAEASRLGWDDYFQAPPSATKQHREAFGWIDVRDGSIGPRDQYGNRLFVGDAATGIGAEWPAVHGVARCPSYVMRRPPWALDRQTRPNPIVPPAGPPPHVWPAWAELVNFPKHDPQAAAATWGDFQAGDPQPLAVSEGLAWFRVYRESAARFIVTCGGGASQGYRAFADAPPGTFADQRAFDDIRAEESIAWYEIEWNPAVGGNDFNNWQDPWNGSLNLVPQSGPSGNGEDTWNSRQFGGTFTFIQRLRDPPDQW